MPLKRSIARMSPHAKKILRSIRRSHSRKLKSKSRSRKSHSRKSHSRKSHSRKSHSRKFRMLTHKSAKKFGFRLIDKKNYERMLDLKLRSPTLNAEEKAELEELVMQESMPMTREQMKDDQFYNDYNSPVMQALRRDAAGVVQQATEVAKAVDKVSKDQIDSAVKLLTRAMDEDASLTNIRDLIEKVQKKCKDGMVRSLESGHCRLIEPRQFKPCYPGQLRDEKTNRCYDPIKRKSQEEHYAKMYRRSRSGSRSRSRSRSRTGSRSRAGSRSRRTRSRK